MLFKKLRESIHSRSHRLLFDMDRSRAASWPNIVLNNSSKVVREMKTESICYELSAPLNTEMVLHLGELKNHQIGPKCRQIGPKFSQIGSKFRQIGPKFRQIESKF